MAYFYLLTDKRRNLLYAGATTDLKKRIDMHVSGRGAKFTRKYNVNILVFYEEFDDRHSAFLREKQIKNWH